MGKQLSTEIKGSLKGKSGVKRRQMRVEKLSYLIWASNLDRAVRFYREVFDAELVRQSEVMAELRIAGGLLGIHSGGEGKRTWTGLAFQVGDLFEGCAVLKRAGGEILREPENTPEEEAHLAMCMDCDGNEIMLTKARNRAAHRNGE